jgi:hypothetical protein
MGVGLVGFTGPSRDLHSPKMHQDMGRGIQDNPGRGAPLAIFNEVPVGAERDARHDLPLEETDIVPVDDLNTNPVGLDKEA